jgi:AraC-like DNA-binding protein
MCIRQFQSVAVPGLLVARQTSTDLHVGVKEFNAIARFEQGKSEWWSRGKVWRSQPGSIQLKQMGDVHRDVAIEGPITFQVVLLPKDDLERARLESKVISDPHLAADDARARPFHRLHDAIDARADRLTLEVAMTEAIAAFTQIKSATPDHTRPVRRAMEYLRDQLGESVTLDDLAAYAGLDKFHLCRAFRAQIGMPPHAYLTHLRIVRAKELLDSGVRAGEVAVEVGLYDQSQLNRHFRRIVGTTPAAYANERH